MFRGEDSVRIRSALSTDEMEGVVEDALGQVGPVVFGRHGFRVSGGRFKSSMTEVEIRGDLRRGRRPNEWVLSVDYSVAPSTLCWVVAVLGTVFLLLGLLVLLVPAQEKGRVQRAVERALRDARDDAEAPAENGGKDA